MRFGLISDTHIPVRARGLPPAVLELFSGVDAIFHAGDFVLASVLHDLKEIAPTHGVLGNCDSFDLAKVVPESATVEAEGMKIGMIHDSGLTAGRRERMAKRFPGHRVVIFGHSHQPVIEDDGSLMLLNPGSACDPRRAKIPSLAILQISEGIPSAQLIHI